MQDGQALLAEKEGGGQQWQPTATEGGHRKRDETKGRKCGICGKSGHNARTCQEVEETSSDEESDWFECIYRVVVELFDFAVVKHQKKRRELVCAASLCGTLI